MAGWPAKPDLSVALDRTCSVQDHPGFSFFPFACHSDAAASLSCHVVAVSTHTHTHTYYVYTDAHRRPPGEFHPRDIFLPRHVQRAAQRNVASLCSFPSSSPFFLPLSFAAISWHSLLSSLCYLLLLRVCQRRSFFAPPPPLPLSLTFLLAVSSRIQRGSQRSRRRSPNMLTCPIFLALHLSRADLYISMRVYNINRKELKTL